MICAEGLAPYDRPPLSKGVLAGTTEIGEIAFRAPDWYEEQRVELLPGRSAAALDAGGQKVSLDDGVVIGTGPDDLILEAAEACPSVAITVVDDTTGETIYP